MPGSERRGKFITFEGIDGAGKTSHLDAFRERLAAHLTPRGQAVVLTREPGGTPLGEALRTLLLHEPMQLATEALLMFAARQEHLATLIAPALDRGDWVLCDRFTDASFAYQGGGRGLPRDKLETLERWVQGAFRPDLTVLFDIPIATAQARREGARAPDRFERESADFFARTRAEYLRRAAESPQRFHVVDASRSIDAIAADLDALAAAICAPVDN